jgi:hypothetical protein
MRGKVRMERNIALAQDEVAAGFVMTRHAPP